MAAHPHKTTVPDPLTERILDPLNPPRLLKHGLKTQPAHTYLSQLKMKKTLVAASILACAFACHAEDTPSFRYLVGADLGTGGDELVSITYTDNSKQIIKAGGGIHIKAGIAYKLSPTTELIATLGYHVDDTDAKNGSISFSRWPVEVLGMWKVSESVRLGGGLRYASNAKIRSSGAASSLGSVDIDSNTGVVLAGEYLFDEKFGMNLRLVSETYKYKGSSIKGDHIAVGLNYYF